MNSWRSGWSASRMTIFAARLVVPPDLIEPATESAPRMNDTGPEASPPPERCSLLERMVETLIPDRSEEHTSELQSRVDLVCRLLLEKKKKMTISFKD